MTDSTVKITKTWQTHFLAKFTRCAKVRGLFYLLCFSGADWLGRQTESGHMDI